MKSGAQTYPPDPASLQAPPTPSPSPPARPRPTWPPAPITLAGSRVWTEALLAEWHSAEVWVPGPRPPRLRVQTEAVAVLL